ncbi:MAG: hypothetical protein R2800_15130 [Flavipsychrobacter sp.]
MKGLVNIAVVLLVTTSMFACCRPDETEVGGKGGNATLKVTPQHHGKDIPNSKVMIKYNTQELPSAYDEEVSTTNENGKPVATFTSLKKGNYYIYAKGYDSSIGQDVVGGIPYTVTVENTQNITVPVTEGQHL